MNTSYFRASARRHMLASVNAAVLIVALILMQFPAMAVAQEEPPTASPSVEATVEVETPKEEAPEELPPEVPEGLTDETPAPVDTEEVVEPPVVVEEETPAETTEEEAPAEARMMMLAAPPASQSNEGGQCEIVSDALTLEGGDSAVLSSYIHSAWTAMINGASWIWGEDHDLSDVSADSATETFTRTFWVYNAVASSTLLIAADNEYIVTLNGDEIGSDSGEVNYTLAGQDVITIAPSEFNVGLNTLVITVKNQPIHATWKDNPAGLKFKLTIDGSNCDDVEPEPKTATIFATKIVCPVESELPDWGDHKDDADQSVAITEDTAADFLEAHPSCHLEPDWEFEWVTDEDSNTNPGDNTGVVGTPWTLFGEEDGLITAHVPAGGKVWVREVMKDGFIPFTGQNTDQNVSAEIYCSTDVLNYDNWDWIDPVEAGEEYHCVAFNAPKTSSVTMCKVNTEQQALSDWTLTLKGKNIQSGLLVPVANSVGVNSDPLVAGMSYIATAMGTWFNDRGDVNGNYVDAEYSTNSSPSWSTAMDGYTGFGTNILELEIDGNDGDWGPVDTNHTYAQSFIANGSSANFAISDTFYGDNKNSNLVVSVDEGYAGVTGEDGCVTFDNVPYGTYDVGEILKDGWTNVSGTGEMIVDQPKETFTIVNTDGELPPENSARIIATKVVCDSEADLPNNSMGKPITAETAQAWVAQSEGACHLESGWEFEWGNQNAGDGGPATIGHAANYTTFGATDVNGVASTYVPLDGITTIQMREVLKEGFIPFTNAGAVSAEFYCANDAAGYDNWEWISNPVAGETYHCVAFNTAVDNGGEPTTSSETLTVSPDAMEGWEFNSDRLTWTMGIGDFVAGPDAAPLNDGSARLTTPTNDERTKLRKYLPAGTQISDITELKYSTYRKDPNGGALTIALQFDVNFDAVPVDPAKADARIVYEPYHTQQAQILDDTWQQWDAMNDAAGTATGSWWIAGPNPGVCPQANPCTWAELNAAYPNMQISAESLENTIDTQGAMLFKAGGSWAGFEGMVDKFVFGLKTGMNTHTTTYDFEPATPSIIDNGGNGGGGGGGSSNRSAARQGEVLGASTAACSALLSTFMKMGGSNDAVEVVELQGFLNEHMGAMLPLTGVFGPMTDAAVHSFQKKYWEDVLKPWFAYPEAGIADLDDSTGYVYKTTQWKINDIVCPDVAPFPALP